MASAISISTRQPNEHIEGIYDEAASYYQHLRWFKSRLTRLEHAQTRDALLAQFRFTHHEGGRYLEIGCGPGTWTKVVAPYVAEVVAMDISENMLAQARTYVSDAQNITFIHGDAAQYQPDQELDGIFSFRVLEYVDGWQDMLTRVASHVRSGGRAVICTKTPFSVYRGTGRERWFTMMPRRAFHRVRRFIQGEPKPQLDYEFWQKYIGPGELREVLTSAGFTDFDVVPAIFGLPIFVNGTCQYPLVPGFAEPFFMRAFEGARRLATRLPMPLRWLSLVFAESYVLCATKR